MKWTRISIDTSLEAEDALSDLLIQMGSGGVQIESNGSNPGKITLIAYFPSDDMIGERVLRISDFIKRMRRLDVDVGAGQVSLESLDEQDWQESWKKFFKPLPIGERILVSPSWEEADGFPSRDVRVQLDPGMAFGTGRHQTTILSLRLLEKVIKGGEEVVDVGTGSGILAITSAKLGAKRVLAIDIDIKAIKVATENSQKNGVSDRISFICGDLISAIVGKFDVLVSNIHSSAILRMLPDFRSYLNPNGSLILSGILNGEVSEIKNNMMNEKISALETLQDDEWVAILAKPSI